MPYSFVDEPPKPKGRYTFLDEQPRQRMPFGRGTGMISSPAEAPASEPSFTRDVLGQTAKDIGTMAYNLPGSTYRLGKEMAKGLWNLGGAAALPPAVQTPEMRATSEGIYEAATHPGETAKSIWGYAKERYTPGEKLKSTLLEDPARAMVDIGGTLWGGGAALKGAGAASKAAGLGRAGEALTAAGQAGATAGEALTKGAFAPITVPAKAAGRVLQAGAAAIPESWPERLYGSAVKFPLSKKWTEVLPGQEVSQRTAAVRAGIENRVLPTEAGLAKVQKLERDIRDMVTESARNATEVGKTADTAELITKGLEKAYKDAANSTDPVGAITSVDQVAQEFMAQGEKIAPDRLLAMKRKVYKDLKESDFGKYTTDVKEAKKGLAHAMMQKLEEFDPAVKALNKKDAAYIKLQEGIERAVGRLGNKDIVSLSDEVMATAGAAAGGLHGGITGFLMNKVLARPGVKSRLAFALDKARKTAQASKTGRGPFGRGTPTPAPEGPVVKPNGEPTATAQAGMQSAPKSEVKGVKKYYRAVPEDRPLNETSDHWYNDTPEAAEATKASLERSTGRPHRIIEIPAEEIEKAGIKSVGKSPFKGVEGNWVETERFVQPESVKGIAGEISLKDKIMNRLDTLITQEGKSTGHPQTREYLAGELAKDGITATGAEIEQAAKNIKTNGVPSTDIERGLIRVLRDEKRANRHTKKPFGRKVKSNEKMLPENIEIKNQPEDYVRAYIDQYSKGEPGINRDLIRPDNSGEIVLRDDKGKVIGVLAHDKDTITDIVIKKSERRKGNAKKLYQYANDIGIVKFKGPFSKQGLSFAEKMESARKPFGRK